MKVVLDETAKEQINSTIECIKLICEMHKDCLDNCPFGIINEHTKIPKCIFYSVPDQWDTIK